MSEDCVKDSGNAGDDTYEITYDERVIKFLDGLDRGEKKYIRIIYEKIEFCLRHHPKKPSAKCRLSMFKGSKQKYPPYHLHVGELFVIFYNVVDDVQTPYVYISNIMRFGVAHDRYSKIL